MGNKVARLNRKSCHDIPGHVSVTKWGKNTQTPKKTYKATACEVLCCCTLCRSTGEVHFKNIFEKGNRALLSTTEEIYGRNLEKDEIGNSRIVKAAVKHRERQWLTTFALNLKNCLLLRCKTSPDCVSRTVIRLHPSKHKAF